MKKRPNRHYVLRDAIKKMKIGDGMVLRGIPASSVKSIVSRLRTFYKGRRRFKTTEYGDNVTAVARLP